VYLLSIRIRHDARSHVPRYKEVRCRRRDDSLKTLGVHTGTRSSDYHVQGLVGCTFAFAVWFQPLTSALTSPDRPPTTSGVAPRHLPKEERMTDGEQAEQRPFCRFAQP
jgi:hypothetical protein